MNWCNLHRICRFCLNQKGLASIDPQKHTHCPEQSITEAFSKAEKCAAAGAHEFQPSRSHRKGRACSPSSSLSRCHQLHGSYDVLNLPLGDFPCACEDVDPVAGRSPANPAHLHKPALRGDACSDLNELHHLNEFALHLLRAFHLAGLQPREFSIMRLKVRVGQCFKHAEVLAWTCNAKTMEATCPKGMNKWRQLLSSPTC